MNINGHIYSPAGQQGLGQARPQGERVALMSIIIQGIRTLVQTFFVFVLIITSLPVFTIVSFPLFRLFLFYHTIKLLESVINFLLDHFDPSHS